MLFDAFRWAHQADGHALLLTDEGDILSTQTLTAAEAYHNMVWEMKYNRDVPVGGIGVQVRPHPSTHHLSLLPSTNRPLS